MQLNQQPELLIETKLLKKAALPFRALNHSLRRQMLQLIHKNGRMTVSGIQQHLRLEQSVASQHLAILRHDRIVNTEREGKFIFYSVNYKRVKELEVFAGQLLAGEPPLPGKPVLKRQAEPGPIPANQNADALLLAVKEVLNIGL